MKIPKNFKIIMECIAGSHLYGTNVQSSDIDIRGIFIPSEEYFFGCYKNVEQYEDKNNDIVYYDIRKFFKLAAECNPNIVELLFIPLPIETFHEDWKNFNLVSDTWRRIVENRDIFLSKKCRWTFSGYAVSQLKRIKRHRAWLLNPPKKKPSRSDFGLPEDKLLVEKEQLGAYNALLQRQDVKLYASDNMVELLQLEKQYSVAKKEWGQYINWKDNRNKDRAVLESKYGYDTKHASHLFRLITEGVELLTTGKITLPRPDAEDILKVRYGGYTYEELMSFIGDIDETFDKYYDKSPLKHKTNTEKIDSLCVSIIKNHLNN